MRFAVHGPGNPVASPRSHGVPRRDIPSRIHIRVAGETAGSAMEVGLALARLPVHMPACRTALACEGRLDPFHPARSFLLQSAHQQSPARGQDLPVEPCLGADVPTRVLTRTFRGSGHVPNLEIFNLDKVKPARNVRAYLLRPVFASIGPPDPQPGDRVLTSGVSVRSAFCAGQLALQAQQPLALSPGQAWNGQQLTSREGRADDHATVDADDVPVARRGHRFGDRREGNVPAPGPVAGYPVRLHAWRHWAGPAEADPPDLWHPDLADMPGHTAHVQ